LLRFGARGVADLAIQHEVEVQAASGAAVLTVPIPAPPGRAGLSPAFSLAYSSAGGNSAFGAGWTLAGSTVVGIDTRERLPRWDGADPFQLDGDELVPWLEEQGGSWQRRRRSEGAWEVTILRRRLRSVRHRVEQWQHRVTGRVHFRVHDARGVVTIYGARPNAAARVADPQDESHTFAWLPELQLDPSGNALWFEYAAETADDIDRSASFERRVPSLAQRYLKRVRYGNGAPLSLSDDLIAGTLPEGLRFCFQLVFDYGEHSDPQQPAAAPDRAWHARRDPFTSGRPGFELRTFRLCRRILSFHEFAALGAGPTLVGALELTHDEDAAGSTLREIRWVGHRRDGETTTSKAVPPLRMTYAPASMGTAFTDAPIETQQNVPAGVGARGSALVDLFGEGLPGILTETDGAWFYKPNRGEGRFGAQVLLQERPGSRPGSCGFGDFDRDGDTDYSRLAGRFAGAFELDRESERWSTFQPFASFPHVEAFGRRAQWIDLDGDGRPDLVLGNADSFTWFPSREDGFGGPIEVPYPKGSGALPTINADLAVDLFFADMNGDGLVDLVHARNGCIQYWPHLGNGRFGDVVVMEDAPQLAAADEFDPARLRFVDLDGSGTADLIYIGRGEVSVFINAGGNRWIRGPRLAGMPYIDNVSSVSVLDFLGDGTPCLVWSTPLPGRSAISYLRLSSADRPRLLLSVDNSMGRATQMVWSSSATHYLRDLRGGRGWSTRLPQHHPVVDEQRTIDAISGAVAVSRYEYHDGYYDGHTRELRGFGQVDVYDSEVVDGPADAGGAAFAAPSLSRSWFHLGTAMVGRHRPTDTYLGDSALTIVPPHVIADEASLASGELDDGLRALAGQLIRSETWATDDRGRLADHPIEVAQSGWLLRRAQPALGGGRAAFSAVPVETVTATYEQVANDPRVTHHLAIEADALDRPIRSADVAYPRRPDRPRDSAAQDRQSVVVTDVGIADRDESSRFELGIPISSRRCELVGLRPGPEGRLTREQLRSAAVAAALTSPGPHHLDLLDDPSQGPRARLLSCDQSLYWNDARAAALPLGQVGALTMVHHEEAACFAPAFVAEVLGDRVEEARLSALGYVQRDRLWWQVDPTHLYTEPDRFSLRSGLERADGASSALEWDEDGVVLRTATDAAGNRVEAVIDYHVLAPWRITDPNGNTSEVRYDPLGVPVVSTTVGHVGAAPWGFEPLAQIAERVPADLGSAIADSTPLLQGGARYQWYDLDAWSERAEPPVLLALARTDLVHDGAGGNPSDGGLEMTVTYLDGLGRTLQQKTLVTPGPAVQRDGAGQVVLDANGLPVMADAATRWRASGHVVYDAKQQPGRQYEPFFTSTFAFEGDAVLARFGVSTLLRYDAVGRPVGQDLPNGTYTSTSYGPWSTDVADANDTVLESAWRAVREGLPGDDPEKQALEKAKPHAGTTRTVFLDPVGRAVATLARGGSTDDRRSEARLSVDGQVRERIDARGLTAFSYRHDMQGRVLYERSIDAGEARALPDGFGRDALTWDARGFETERSFDGADRLLSVLVRGGDGPAPLDHRVLERVYGEQVPDAALRNLRGQVVTVRDGAGEVTTDAYDPGGKLLSASRRLRTAIDSEPDWRGAVPLDSEAFAVAATFDALGRLRREALPDGSVCDYAYQPGGPLDRVRITTPDGALTEQPILDGASYDARGQRARARLGNGVELGWTYEPDTFRLREQTARRGTRLLQDIGYTYDPVGNLVRLTDAAQEGPGALIGGASLSARRDYEYDAHYRLRRATGRVHQALLDHDWVPGTNGTVKGTRHLSFNNGAALERFTRTYDYDAASNLTRIRHIGATQRFTNDFWISPTSNRSLPALDLGGSPVQDPESKFDAAGQVRAMDHLRALEWGWHGTLDRAVTIERRGGTDDDERYVYGADGQRVRKVTTRLVQGDVVEVTEKVYFGACERKRVLRGSRVLLERWTTHVKDSSGRLAIVHRWTRDDLGREVTDVTRPRVRYQLSTHQGSSALELDDVGALISYEEYFPHGGTAFIAGDDLKQVELKEYRYSAKERDDATSFYYYGYRYYAPWMGRWLSPDPIGPKDDLNLYQFVLGDPVGNVDHDGLETNGGDLKYEYSRKLSEVQQAGFDSLSDADKRRFALEKVVLVPKDPKDLKGEHGWTLLTVKEYQDTWLPAKLAFAKSRGDDVIVTVLTENPSSLPGDGGSGTKAIDDSPAQEQPVQAPATKKDPGTTDAASGATTDASKGKEANAKDSGDGSGKDKTGGAGKGTGTGAHGTGTTGQGGPGARGGILGGTGAGGIAKLGGLRGGRETGVTGGTPFSTGHTQGGQGNGPDDAGLGVGTGTAGRASSGELNSPTGGGADGRPGVGDSPRPQSQNRPTPSGSQGSPSSDQRGDTGDGPGGANQDASKSGGHERTSWDAFMTVGDIASLQVATPDGGTEHGISGGFGSTEANRFVQALTVGLAVVDFILLATGIAELLEGLVNLARGLFRLAKKFLTELPQLLRLGARALRNLFTLTRSAGSLRGLFSSARELLPGARRFFSAGRISTGAAKTFTEVMDAFEKVKHTVHSRRVLDAIKNGDIEMVLKKIKKLGFTSSAGKITINNTLHMEELVTTVVHEGQHAFDLAEKVIRTSAVSKADILFAEMRAYLSAGRFAELNEFALEVRRLVGMRPDDIAANIVAELDELIGLDYQSFLATIRRFGEGPK
jgi:RHS repeat-associated protein